MADVLSQSEIEALLASMSTVEEDGTPNSALEERLAATAAPAGTPGQTVSGRVFLPLRKRRRAAAGAALGDPRFAHSSLLSYEHYDFRRPDKLSKEHLRSLQLLHETFADHFGSSLAGYLRTQVEIEVASVEQLPYDEYMRSISASLLNVLNVAPLSGQAIFEVDFGILFSMLDRLLGGSGAAGKIVRDLTDIERSLASNIVELALHDLKTGWENVNEIAFEVASMETSAQFVQIVPGNDTVVLVMFEIRMGEHQGAMSMCLPYLLIKPILSRLSAQRWFVSSSKRPSALYAAQLAQRLRTTRVPCVARLGTSSLTVADVVNLEVGQILPMRVSPEAEAKEARGRIGSVDLMIGGQVKFRGRTGLRGKALAVQIEEVAAPPPELIAHKETT
ncbi:MAG: flagellar motor switch protein FliM [Armatimonadetes bacterium]|nr:flagellar motor switch protein FliM [Armatimonadota bacterium]